MSRKIRLSRMINRAGDVVHELSNLHFSSYRSIDSWTPDINAYRYDDRFEIWVDLAGVEKEAIRLEVLPDRVRFSGERNPPMPVQDEANHCRQVLSMEIESGRFAREIVLPMDVDRNQVAARQENGLLRIILPFAKEN